VDDISWWAEGADDREVAAKLTAAAAASIERAAGNGVAFHHGKTEAAFFWKGGEEGVGTHGDGGSWRQQCPVQQDHYKVAWSMAQFAAHNQRPPRHTAEGGVQGYGSAPPPHGQMGLSPANCRKVMTACVQFVTMFGAELWRKGDQVWGTMGQAD